MGTQLWVNGQASSIALMPLSMQLSCSPSLLYDRSSVIKKGGNLSEAAPCAWITGRRGGRGKTIIASSNAAGAPPWDSWKPEKSAPSPSLSDVLWPAAGSIVLAAPVLQACSFLLSASWGDWKSEMNSFVVEINKLDYSMLSATTQESCKLKTQQQRIFYRKSKVLKVNFCSLCSLHSLS